jgi:hypothetical protein
MIHEERDVELQDMFIETEEMQKLRIGCGFLIMAIILLTIAIASILIGP